MRKELPPRHPCAVDRRKRGRAPDAGVDAFPDSRAQKRQRAVDPAMPQHLAAEELLRVMRIEPRFTFAVADLLAPVGFHARAAVVPDERRGRKPDAEPLGLQPPADIDVVAGAKVDRVEAVDRQQGVAAERHVAARHVLCDAVVEHDVTGSPGRARDTLRYPGIVLRHDVRAACAGDIGKEHRLNQVGQPIGINTGVCVGVGDDLAGCGRETDVARCAEAAVGRVDDPHAGISARDRSRSRPTIRR